MFRPSLHGWRFPNEYTCSGPELGIGGPPPPELGLGGGLCWAALDRYLRGAPIGQPAEAPEPGDPLYAELIQRQIAALAGVWGEVREWQECEDGSWRDRLPVPVPIRGSDLASRTRAGLRALRRRLAAGEPVLLTLLTRAGAYDRPRSIRQVLATGWDRSGLRVRLSIYDPDQPGDDGVQLGFNLAGRLEARITGGDPVRGFFAVPYDRPQQPVARAEAFDNRSVIGLNRTIRGEAHTAVGPKHFDLVARNERGALLHFQRRRGRHWEGVNVTESGSFGSSELHSDPVAFHRLGTLHVFARSYTGDLLHFRKFRSWSLANRTDHKRVGPRFRLEGRPVAVPGPQLQISVIGRDPDGGLVHYHATPFRGWRAEQVPGDRVAGDPVAARGADALHVVALTDDGRVLHWTRDPGWTMTDTDAGPGPEIRLLGRPWLDLSGDPVRVFGRTRDDDLVVLELGDDGVWQRIGLAPNLAGDPVATPGPSGLHVFAPTVDGGLVHAWWDGLEWRSEDVVASRPTLGHGGHGSAQVAAWGSRSAMRVFLRRGSRLRVYTWTPDADWVMDPLTDRAGSRPIGFRSAVGNPHVVFTDGSGTILHVETGDWKEPGREDTSSRRPAEAASTAAEPAAADPVDATVDAAATQAEDRDSPEPDELESEVPDLYELEAGGLEGYGLETDEPEAYEPEAYEPEPYEPEAAEPEPYEPEAVELDARAAASEDDGTEPIPPEAEAETETMAAAADGSLEAEPREADTAAAALSENDTDPELGTEAEPAEEEVPPLPLLEDPADWDDEDPAELTDPVEPATADAGPGERVEDDAPASTDDTSDEDPAQREWEWEDRRPSTSPDEIEPMDLSLLDTWPKSPRERRRAQARKRKESSRENGSGQDDD